MRNQKFLFKTPEKAVENSVFLALEGVNPHWLVLLGS
jgi:hypothetical protein